MRTRFRAVGLQVTRGVREGDAAPPACRPRRPQSSGEYFGQNQGPNAACSLALRASRYEAKLIELRRGLGVPPSPTHTFYCGKSEVGCDCTISVFPGLVKCSKTHMEFFVLPKRECFSKIDRKSLILKSGGLRRPHKPFQKLGVSFRLLFLGGFKPPKGRPDPKTDPPIPIATNETRYLP